MWYKFAQYAEILNKDNTLREEIMDAIATWIRTTPPYSQHEYTGLSDAITLSKIHKDEPTTELLNAMDYGSWNRNPKVYEDVIAEYGDHPAIKHLAQKYRFSNDKKAFYSDKYIKNTISDWYKTEYKIELFRQNKMQVPTSVNHHYIELSNSLSEMLVTAAKRWLLHHEYQLGEVHKGEGHWGDDGNNNMLKTEENMLWILDKLNNNEPNAAFISIALQMMHLSGSVLEYIPQHVDQDNTYSRHLGDMKAFLDSMSDEKMVGPAEKEFKHQQISELYPKEEHSKEWLYAHNKKLNVR